MTGSTYKIGGERYYTAHQAARLIGDVHPSTVRRWIKNGKTSFGSLLDVRIRDGHGLIPEYRVDELKTFLHDYPLPGPDAKPAYRKVFREVADEMVSMDSWAILRKAERQSRRDRARVLKAKPTPS